MNQDIRRAAQWRHWVEEALLSLRGLPYSANKWARVAILERAASCVKVALSYANNLNCADRRGLCLKVLSWIRTDLNRLTERSAA